MIRPIAVNSDGSVVIVFDELGHTGTVTPASISFSVPDGTPDYRTLVLTCPDGCGSASYHPITGDGLCRALIQEAFVRQVRLKGCPCGVATIGRPFAVVIAHIRSHVQANRGNWEANQVIA